MKKLVACLVVGLVFVSGCKQKSERGGSAAKGKGFSLALDNVKISKGEEKEAKITIKREKEFTDEVTLTFKAEKPLTVTPDSVKVPGDEDVGKVMIKADDTLKAKTDYTIKVTATPKTGDKVEKDWVIKGVKVK